MEFDATFLISVISFVVFVFIMNIVFYTPIMRIMEKRNNFVEDNFNSANNINKETQKQEKYHANELEISRNEAKNVLDNEIQRMKTEKSKTIADYKSELYSNVNFEKENLRQSALDTKEILKDNVVDIAKNISNILLGSSVDNAAINKSQIHIREEQV